MVTWWSDNGKAIKAATDPFEGPCRTAETCDLYFINRYFTLYSILVDQELRLEPFAVRPGAGPGARAVAYRATGGDASAPLTWACPHCQAVNPDCSYTCANCACALV